MPDGTSRFSIDGKVVYHFMGCSTFSGAFECLRLFWKMRHLICIKLIVLQCFCVSSKEYSVGHFAPHHQIRLHWLPLKYPSGEYTKDNYSLSCLILSYYFMIQYIILHRITSYKMMPYGMMQSDII